MFRGRYEHTMTKTGRVSIPSKFREVCRKKYSEETFVVTNFDRYLIAYPMREWNELEKKLSKISITDSKVISSIRYLMGNAVDCPIDNQGRVLIPHSLRSYAVIETEVILVGMLKKIEIWSKEIWEKENGSGAFETFIQSREVLAGYGL